MSVEEGYVDGVPKHRLPSAYDKVPTEEASCMFVCNFSQYLGMSTPELHRIIRDRHILITDVPVSGIKFNLNGLQRIGDVHVPRSIQSKYYDIQVISYSLWQTSHVVENRRGLEEDDTTGISSRILPKIKGSRRNNERARGSNAQPDERVHTT